MILPIEFCCVIKTTTKNTLPLPKGKSVQKSNSEKCYYNLIIKPSYHNTKKLWPTSKYGA
jgi:hypothetical protein